MTFGTFIAPDRALEGTGDLAGALEIGSHIRSGHRALTLAGDFAGKSRIFDRIVERLRALDLAYEDQCTAHYYFDLVRTLRDFNGEFGRVVEVGVFMGGATTFIAGCAEPFEFDIDLVDVEPVYLRFAYERVRRMYPEAAARIRLFHGDLPSYVRHVMLGEEDIRCLVHHDGSHAFNDVVKDMASLYYVRERIHAIIAQDTHLRGTSQYMNFVDMALFAVFGTDLKFAPIGISYGVHDDRTAPNPWQGNYFMPDTPEGVVIPMALNSFRYPHPALAIEQFLPLAD